MLDINTVYVISYLGETKSKDDVEAKIKLWLADGWDVCLISQCWNTDIENDKLREIHSPVRLSPSKARNIALRELYDSTSEYGMIVDDDVVGVDYMGFINWMRKANDADVELLDVILPTTDQETVLDEYTAVMTNKGNGGVFLIRNFNMYGITSVFFDESFDWYGPLLLSGEDHEFVYSIFKRNLGAYRISDFKFESNGPTTWDSVNKLPEEMIKHIYNEKYGDFVKIPSVVIRIDK